MSTRNANRKENKEEDEEEDCTDTNYEIPKPKVAVLCVGPDAVSFAVEPHLSPQIFNLVIEYSAAEQRGILMLRVSPSVDITGLCPGTDYTFTITRRTQSSQTCVRVITKPIPPQLLSVSDIRADSVTPSLEPPAGEVQNYSVTYSSGEVLVQEFQTEETSVTIRDLRPGQQYLFSVCAQLQNRLQSEAAETSIHTKPGQPGAFRESEIRADSVTLSWEPPAGEVQNYSVICSSGEDVVQEVQTEETSVTIRDLKPVQQYLFSVCAQLQRLQSEAAETSTHTKPGQPGAFTVSDIRADSVTLSWEPPAGEVKNYSVTYSSEDVLVQEFQTEETSVTIRDLRPGQQYLFSVCAQLQNRLQSKAAETSTHTKPGQPGAFTVSDIRADRVTLSWEPPAGEVKNYSVTYSSEDVLVQEFQTEETSVTIRDLRPGQQYLFSVCAQLQRLQSEAAETSTHTKPGQPGAFTVSDIRADSVTLSWEPPAGEVQNYSVIYSSEEVLVQEVQTEETSVTIRDLKPGQQYLFSLCAQLQRLQSEDAETFTHTKPGQPGAFTVSDIRADSVTLSWEPPAGEVKNYSVTYSSEDVLVQEFQTEETSVTIRDLRPGQQYLFSVCAQLQRLQSEAAETSTHTKPGQPGAFTVSDIRADSVTLSWEPPAGEVQNYSVTCSSGEVLVQEVQTEETSVTIRDLRPGQQYLFSVCSQLQRLQSEAAETSTHTKPGQPGAFTVSDIRADSVTLSWEPPAGEVQNYSVTYSSEEDVVQEFQTENTSVTIRDLRPGQQYLFSVCAQLQNRLQSQAAETSIHTKPGQPGAFTVSDIRADCVTLSWEPPAGEVQNYSVTCSSGEDVVQEVQTEKTSVTIRDLRPGQQYLFSVCAQLQRLQSEAAETSTHTKPGQPGAFTVSDIRADCVTLSWEPPAGEVQNYSVICSSGEDVVQEVQTEETSVTIRDLRPGQQYLFSVCAQLQRLQSEAVETSTHTKTHVESVLEDLDLEIYYNKKLCLNKVLQIDEKTMTENNVMLNKDVAWHFLKKLMMVNVKARNVKCTLSETNFVESSDISILDLENVLTSLTSACTINPLDIITALFLCSDSFVQQELSLKMSMCQFAVPLLLPNCDTNQCTLMLWALRDIVKKYRPKSLSESKGFKEERVVNSEFPMISFVRLGECSLSKSEILNKLLSNSQQYHDTFVHRDMQCGDNPRIISNGLAELTWYLPCGNKNIDIFDEPVAVANLRGDSSSFETQFSFLCQASSAVFVFYDSLVYDWKKLEMLKSKAEIFLVGNHQCGKICMKTLHKIATELGLTNSSIIMKTKQMNDADFVEKIQKTMRGAIENSKLRIQMEQMTSIAHELGVHVDEDSPECQRAKFNADAITAEIQDMMTFKETQLPMQGQIWKDVTSLEKEQCRLRKAGSENIDEYKCNLDGQIKDHRKKQNSYGISPSMAIFLTGISSPDNERCFFLKWLRINLDNISRDKLSWLREQYKEKSKESNNNEIKEIDRQLSNSSLGTEHFFREMGQLYEASLSLPKEERSRQQLQDLPKLCAQLLIDGFPLELVDGDASNIPLRWVSDVLTQLHELVSPNNKILVVTVLGVQSTGKSTLLNTMFGMQFAVSSGRCTRGAFMLLIRVSENMKASLNCDFLVIIDTEGLKSPELAQLDDSHEHDNELATLVVGLSDITIINIAMENSTDMKDILQIVVHAFLRMKEVGKKPRCQFVHQNVSDVSAHDNNLRDRKLLLQQLNEMTQAAAKMEKKEENKSFTDVMDYDPDTGNWYIPGLWNGSPPMAPVNVGYSEAVQELKKNVVLNLEKCGSSVTDILEFCEWIRSLWNAVKHENFIFSFRNSLVADAYTRLCTEYNKWEWEFKKAMFSWVTNAETQICNIGVVAENSDIGQVLADLKLEAQTELCKWETVLLDNLKDYFKQTEGHVHLVEGYKEQFFNSAKICRREIESSVINQLTATAEIKQGMENVDKMKENHTKDLEERVCALIDKCRKEKHTLTDQDLDAEFNRMWETTVTKMKESVSPTKTKDVFVLISHHLRTHISSKGSHANELVSTMKLQDCGSEDFVVKPVGSFERIKNTFCKWFNREDNIMAAQKLADSTITVCQEFISEKVEIGTDYHDTYIQEILRMIDDKLNCNRHVHIEIEFEFSLKQHICGYAARRFQKMHEDFLHKNDPFVCLNKNKEKFCADFKDVFNEKDQCQKKANEFTDLCLRPAVERFVSRSLGPDIVSEMQTCHQFSTRTAFQYHVLLDLITNEQFERYYHYICNYEVFVKGWIHQKIVEHFSNKEQISELENKHLQKCFGDITSAIKKASTENGTLKEFIELLCKDLMDKLVISQDALGAFMILNNADQEQFADWLTKCVSDMMQTLKNKFEETEVDAKLKQLSLKPHEELSDRMFGCGQQCPFCKAPCEAGGKGHTEHWASLHQSQGLGQYRWTDSEKLICDICTTLVQSDSNFRCLATKGEWHPYKRYTEKYRDWKISADASLEASDYWKYVLTKFNHDFAEAYKAKPADIPNPWKSIGKKDAIKSLQTSFYME